MFPLPAAGNNGYQLLRRVSYRSSRIGFGRPTVLVPVESLVFANSSAVKALDLSSAWSEMKMEQEGKDKDISLGGRSKY